MDQNIFDGKSENLKYYLKLLKSWCWAPLASEETIDSSFKSALELEEMFRQKEESSGLEKYDKNNSQLNFKRPVDALMENLLQNHKLDENLILYAIKKYILLYSERDFSELLDKILSEIELRKQIFNLTEKSPSEDLDFFSLNTFLCDLLNSSNLKYEVLNSLKNKTAVFLKAIKHSSAINQELLVEEMIACLESQTDLRLWFKMMKDENIQIVIDLCAQYDNFLNAVLRFFDKFAHEIESNYDEELNVFYSHINLDFEDFVRILQLFLNKKNITKAINEYLESKTVTDKNFCFWVDVRTCL